MAALAHQGVIITVQRGHGPAPVRFLCESSAVDLDDYDRKMLALINQYGLAVQGVGGDDQHAEFQYTVGLAGHDMPEFIVYGLPMQVGQQILNHIGGLALRGTAPFEAGDTVINLVGNFPVRLLRVVDTDEDLRVSNRIYGDPNRVQVEALQIVFPDAESRWPWDAGSGVGSLPVQGPVVDSGRTVHLSAFA